jgi:hypothetical protein
MLAVRCPSVCFLITLSPNPHLKVMTILSFRTMIPLIVFIVLFLHMYPKLHNVLLPVVECTSHASLHVSSILYISFICTLCSIPLCEHMFRHSHWSWWRALRMQKFNPHLQLQPSFLLKTFCVWAPWVQRCTKGLLLPLEEWVEETRINQQHIVIPHSDQMIEQHPGNSLSLGVIKEDSSKCIC